MSETRVYIAAAIVGCAPFVPLLFQGEEWGATTPFQYFTDHSDAGLGAAVTEGRRAEFAAFGWAPDEVPDPQDEQTWLASRLRWEEAASSGHAALLGWYRQVLALRAGESHLTDGRCDTVEVGVDRDGDGWFWFRRGPITLAVNLCGGPRSIELAGPATVALAWPPEAVAVAGRRVRFTGEGVAVLRS